MTGAYVLQESSQWQISFRLACFVAAVFALQHLRIILPIHKMICVPCLLCYSWRNIQSYSRVWCQPGGSWGVPIGGYSWLTLSDSILYTGIVAGFLLYQYWEAQEGIFAICSHGFCVLIDFLRLIGRKVSLISFVWLDRKVAFEEQLREDFRRF